MKALYKESFESWDIAVKETNRPIPREDEVVIKVHFAGICGTDLKIADGHYHSYIPPLVMGHEFSGTVSELGENVKSLNVGEKVVARTIISSCGTCEACFQGKENLCIEKRRIGFDQDGVFANYVKVKREQIHRLPETIDLNIAVLLEPLSVVTHALRNVEIKPSDIVFISGPGSIGLLAAVVCKAKGATVIMSGLDKDSERLSAARGLGVNYNIILDKEENSGRNRILEITKGKGPNIVLECSGTATGINYGLEICQPAGTFIQIGTRSEPLSVDFMKIAYKEIQVSGSIGHTKADWEQAIQFMSNHSSLFIHFLNGFYPLEKWEEAFHSVKNGKAIKAIFRL